MALNLITLILVPALIVFGVLLLRRSLQATSTSAATANGKCCVACGTPAELFTSFACPVCGRDAREQGLWEPSGSSASPFWRVMILSFLMIPLGIFLAIMMTFLAPSQSTFGSETTLTPNQPSRYHAIQISANGSGRRDAITSGTLTADVILNNGGITSFEVQSPSMETVVKGNYGEVLDRGKISAEMINRWLPELVPFVSEKPELTDGEAIMLEINRALRLKEGSVSRRTSKPGVPSNFLITGGSSGMTGGPPLWIVPVTLLITAIIWLLMTLRTIRRVNRSTAQRPDGAISGGVS